MDVNDYNMKLLFGRLNKERKQDRDVFLALKVKVVKGKFLNYQTMKVHIPAVIYSGGKHTDTPSLNKCSNTLSYATLDYR